jgi:hypothetical protein
MVIQVQKKINFDLTGFEAGSVPAEVLAPLERDRWPEFYRELYRRRLRKVYFDIHHYGLERQVWAWMVGRSRTWAEVERVLNQHRVDWKRANRHEVTINGATIYRMR